MTVTRDSVYRVFSDRLMGLLALLIVPLTILDFATVSLESTLFVADWLIITVFLLEYALKLYVAPSRRGFVTGPTHLLDLAIITLPFLAVFPTALQGTALPTSSPLLRLLRVPRAALLTGRAVGALDLHRVLARNSFYHVLGLSLAVYFGLSYLFYVVEAGNSRVASLYDALWWGLGYLSTVGSEIAPQTSLGRVLGVAMMVTGISFIGILTANLVNFFMEIQKSSRPQLRKSLQDRLDRLELRLEELASTIKTRTKEES